MRLIHSRKNQLQSSGDKVLLKSECFPGLDYVFVDVSAQEKEFRFTETREFYALNLTTSSSFRRVIELEVPSSIVCLLHVNEGEVQYGSEDTSLNIPAGAFNLLLSPFSGSTIQLQSRENGLDISLLTLDTSSFTSMLNLECSSHHNVYRKLLEQDLGLLDQSQESDFSMRYVLSQLTAPTPADRVEHLNFNSKCLEVMARAFALIDSESCCNSPEDCEFQKLKPLVEVRKILEENLASPPGLSKISKLVGLNEYDLKKRFKEHYGNTVFGYLAEMRMQYAWKLLQDEKKTVGEASTMVGYKNPQHFSAAFKKRFGFSPSGLNS